jgi:hypothetical protein
VISRHPARAALAAIAVIAVLAVPALSMTLNMPDESAQAAGTMGRASYQTMAEGFGPGFGAPLIVAAAGADPGAGGSTAAGTALERALARAPGVARVTPPVVSPDGRAVMLIAYPTTSEQDPATNALVNRLSDQVVPRAAAGTGLTAYLTGPNAGNVTFANTISARMPWLIGVVAGLSMLLLLVVFRSVAVAIKAAVMNLLSIGAAYGVLVAVTQWGWGHQLFGFPEKIPVTTWVPMFLFVILFGLSMDYEVFLLAGSRRSTTGPATTPPRWPAGWPARPGSSVPPPRSWSWCSVPSSSARTSRSSRSVSGWPSPCWSTPRSSGSSWCPPSWNCSAGPTGGCRAGWGGSCPARPSRSPRWSPARWLWTGPLGSRLARAHRPDIARKPNKLTSSIVVTCWTSPGSGSWSPWPGMGR